MWVNPLTIMGAMSIPFLASNIATFIGFLLATFFTLSYTKIFYEGRQKPMSWVFIISGLAAFCISELGQLLLPYRVAPMAIEAMIVLIAQNSGAILIAAGAYMLFKEVPQ